MIKPAGLLMAAVMAGVTAGTYYGLDLLPPGTIPPPLGRVPPPPPPPIAATPPETAAAPTTSSPPAAPAPEAPASRPPPTEQELAEEPPPPPEPKAAAAPATTPAPPPAPAAEAKAEAAPAPAPKPEPKPAPAPKTASKTAPKPAPEKPAAVEKREPKPAQTANAETAAPAALTKPKPPEADVIKPWWPDASKMPANQLKLMYAGQVKGEQAIALLFSAPLSLDTVKQNAQIKSDSGETIAGDWELGKNPRLAVFRGLKPGRYTVILAPEIADSKGFMLGATLKGPVYVQAPDAQ